MVPTGRRSPEQMREVVRCWLDLVVADAELAPCLVGVDRERFAQRLVELLCASLGEPGDRPVAGVGPLTRGRPGPPGQSGQSGWTDAPDLAGVWRGLGLTETQHRRVIDYLGRVLWALNVPPRGSEADRCGR